MLRDFNILVVVDDEPLGLLYAKKFREMNKTYNIINKIESIKSKSLEKFLNLHKSIVVVKSNTIKKVLPYQYINFCEKTNSLPIYIILDDTEDSYNIYLNMFEQFKQSIVFKDNEENKELDEFLELIKPYLMEKGDVMDDKPIYASENWESRPINV